MVFSRPLSITITAWVILIWGLTVLVLKIYAFSMPGVMEMSASYMHKIEGRALIQLPLAVHMALSLLTSAVMLISGFFILRGKNWARWLLLGCFIFALISYVPLGGALGMVAFKVPLTVIIAFILLRPKANAYFKQVK